MRREVERQTSDICVGAEIFKRRTVERLNDSNKKRVASRRAFLFRGEPFIYFVLAAAANTKQEIGKGPCRAERYIPTMLSRAVYSPPESLLFHSWAWTFLKKRCVYTQADYKLQRPRICTHTHNPSLVISTFRSRVDARRFSTRRFSTRRSSFKLACN